MPAIERIFERAASVCDDLLKRGFEVGLLVTLRDAETGLEKDYASWFVVSEDLLWWDDSEAYGRVQFSFCDRQPTRDGVWRTHPTHDPVRRAIHDLMDAIDEGDAEIVSDPRVVVQVDGDIIDHSDVPRVGTNTSIRMIRAFKERHMRIQGYSVPEPDIHTLRDVVLARYPAILQHAIRCDVLDAADTFKWQPVAAAASRAFRV